MPETVVPIGLLSVGLLCLGLLVGSFLNVVIYRLPLIMESRWRRDCCELLDVEPRKRGDAVQPGHSEFPLPSL